MTYVVKHFAKTVNYNFIYKLCIIPVKEYFNRHIKTVHENSETHLCTLCDKAYVSKRNLDLHKRTVHEGSKIFKCDSCDKGFVLKQRLTSHVKAVHMNIKDYN